jgi:hypothetical protein
VSRPLDGVEAKLHRARDHLETFHAAFQEIYYADPVRFEQRLDPVDREHILWTVVYVPNPPPVLGVIAGDALNNLRSALDHVVWQLALRHTPKPSRSIAFPITRSAEEFAEKSYMIAHLSDEERAIVARYQPYNRGDEVSPLKELSRLVNRDKHQVLNTLLQVPSAVGVTFYARGTGSIDGPVELVGTGRQLEPGTVLARMRVSGDPEIEMQGQILPEVEFEDGWSGSLILMLAASEVLRITQEFEPILEPQDVALPSQFKRRRWPNFNTLGGERLRRRT